MKYLFLRFPFLAILVIPVIAKSQVPDYFQVQPVWHQYYTGLDMQMNCYFTENAMFYVHHDTLINGDSYHAINRVYLRHYGPIGPTTCNPDILSEQPDAALLRQDSMHIYQWYSNSECLLYDFSWQAGDTISSTTLCWIPMSDSIVVDSVVSRNLPVLGMRKFFYWHFTNHTWNLSDKYVILEGIGGEGGLTEVWCSPFEFTSELNCYWNNDTIVYSPGFQNCTQSLGIDASNPSQTAWTIQPNPASDVAFISFPQEPVSGQLRLTDMNGRSWVTALLTASSVYLLDLRSVPPGMYIITFTDASGSTRAQKLIRQ